MRSIINRLGLSGFVASLVLIVLVAWFNWQQSARMRDAMDRVEHTEKVRDGLDRLLLLLQDVESGARGFLLTGDATYLDPFEASVEKVKPQLQSVRQMTADNPRQQAACNELFPLVDKRLEVARNNVMLRETAGIEIAVQEVSKGLGKALMDRIRSIIVHMRAEEQALLEARAEAVQREASNAKWLGFTGAALSFVLLIAVFAMMVRENRLRRKSEIQLQRSNGELDRALRANQLIMEHSLDAICTLDAQGRFVFASAACERLWGYTPAEMTGRSYVEMVHPDDLESSRQAAADILQGKPLRDFENRYRRKDGSHISIVWSASWSAADGLMFCLARDATERKLNEEKIQRLNEQLKERAAQLQDLFESLPGLYVVLSPDLKIVAVSDAYLQATMTRREDIVGRGLFEVFPDNPDDPKADGVSNLRSSLDRVRQTGVAHTMAIQKYDVRRPDGVFEERYWSPINSPVLGAGKRIEYIIHRAEDVTEFVRRKPHSTGDAGELQKRLERMEAEIFQSSQQVQAANRQLEIANKELESFSYSVSHDLRAPLRHIHGYVEMLTTATAGTLSEKASRYLKIITEASVEMGHLIDDLLAFSRMSRTEMHASSVDMDAAIRDTIRRLEMSVTGRNIDWKIARLPEVEADPAMIKQVLGNLIGNAVKYSRQRDPALIEIGCAGEEDGKIVFFVRDNGAGFDMRYAHKLFGVFQRLHRSDEFEGTGIGLAIVQRVIARHGGRVWAESEVGKGATFYFTLKPVATDPDVRGRQKPPLNGTTANLKSNNPVELGQRRDGDI